jgi:hypothetical protein
MYHEQLKDSVKQCIEKPNLPPNDLKKLCMCKIIKKVPFGNYVE